MKASEFLQKNPVTQEIHQKVDQYLREVERLDKVRAFQSCGICGGGLKFVHRTDWVLHAVEECGHCPSCQQSTPKRIFKLN